MVQDKSNPNLYNDVESIVLSRQGELLASILKTIAAITFIAILLIAFLPGFSTYGNTTGLLILNSLVILFIGICLYALHIGYILQTFLAVIAFNILVLPYTIYTEIPANMQMLTIMVIPIALAGFLPKRKQFWLTFFLSIAVLLLTLWAAVIFKELMIGYPSVITLVMMLTILALMTDGISSSYRQSVRATAEQLFELKKAHEKLVAMNDDLDRAILERTRAESISSRSAITERLALETAGAGIFGLNVDSLDLQLSPDFLQRSGLHQEIAHWQQLLNLMKPESQQFLNNSLLLIKAGEANAINGDVELTTVPALTWFVSVELNTTDGSLNGVVVDVTERILQQQERQILDDKLKETQRLESLGVLAGGIAHDFNNFLHVITLSADVVRRSPKTAPEAITSLDNLLTTADRAAELCSQLLAYSGRGKFNVQPFDLEKVVLEMKQLLEVSKPANTQIDYKPDGSHPIIKCDLTQIRQIIMNLITNSGDAIGDQPGKITVSTRTQHIREHTNIEGKIAFKLTPGEYACIEVEDDGCGMSEQVQQKMFDPFFTTKSSGRGLGLSAVLGIVNSHNGAVAISSIANEGTKIQVLLPISSSLPADDASSVIKPEALTGVGKILFADDEPEIRNLGKIILTDAGFDVIEAIDGSDAIDKFLQYEDELVLAVLDVMMPGKTGIEVFSEISARKPDLPIILSSGFNENETMDQISDHQHSAFLKKPYLSRTMLDVVQRMLNTS